MPNKKGFTLVELLAIIAILAMIMIMTFPTVSGAIKRSKERTYESQVKLIEDATSGYVSGHVKELLPDGVEVAYISLADLKANKVVQNKKVTNPKTGEAMNGCAKVSKDSYGQYKVKYYENSCEELGNFKKYNIGEEVYFDPAGIVRDCASGKEWTPTNTETTCYKWNVVKDNGITIEMLLDHNVTAKVAWNSSGNNMNGPLEVYNQLKNDTNGWTRVETLKSSDNVVRSHGSSGTYTIDYNGMKARLISGQEIADIGGDKDWTPSNHTGKKYLEKPWIYQNLEGANTTTKPYGYWTDTAFSSNTTNAWNMIFDGGLGNGTIIDAGGLGVRPVVRVSKSVL